jgi:hypothetical protein
MSRSYNSRKGHIVSWRRSDPWDLMNRTVPTDQKDRLKRQTIEHEWICYYNIVQPVIHNSIKYDWSKRS